MFFLFADFRSGCFFSSSLFHDITPEVPSPSTTFSQLAAHPHRSNVMASPVNISKPYQASVSAMGFLRAETDSLRPCLIPAHPTPSSQGET